MKELENITLTQYYPFNIEKPHPNEQRGTDNGYKINPCKTTFSPHTTGRSLVSKNLPSGVYVLYA